MSTMNISLPEALKAFVDERIASGQFGTSSEYVRELIRADMERLALRQQLLKGLEGDAARAATAEWFDALRQGTQAKPSA